jgi:peptidoglycan/LPS O-acetylase OafA/YrhL
LSFLGKVFTQLLGDAAAAARRKDAEASLGAIAAFFGTLSLVFALCALSGASDRASFDYMGAVTVCTMALLCLAGSYGSLRAGRKAPLVTRRHLGLATYGRFISWVGIFVSALALALSVDRVVEWRL